MEFGFLIITGLPDMAALTQSGIILSFAKSPPPITLPALAVETGKSAKKLFL